MLVGPPPLRESSQSVSSTLLDQVLGTSLPNEVSILTDPLFDSSLDWGTVQPLDIGESILKMCRENQIALPDLSRKLRELCEREQYWATGPNGQGGVTESFAKRLFE